MGAEKFAEYEALTAEDQTVSDPVTLPETVNPDDTGDEDEEENDDPEVEEV
jgi:hypothetical protein